MIEITSVTETPNFIKTYSESCPVHINSTLDVEFILFNKIVCNCTFEDKDFIAWDSIKIHIENQLTEDFNKSKQLEGKQSNLKTK